MDKELSFNDFQTAIALLQPKYNYMVSGRGFGKSTYFGYQMHQIVSHMPGASGIIAAKTYTHVLTSILPSAFAHLERMGYLRDVHYVIGKQPPKSWKLLPYHTPVKDFSNYITFFNKERPSGFFLTSQERLGSGRGPNTDFLMTDETLRLDKQRLDNELAPTLRANKDKFKHIPWHLGEYHSTSMPYTNQSRWILEQGDYYLRDYSVDYFSLWRQVVKMQLELLDMEDPAEFSLQWNEIQKVRRLMAPRLSKDGETLFTLSNAIDNMHNVGLSYIKQQRKKLPEIIFLIEIMNMIMTMNENAFYSLSEDKHVYFDGWDDELTNNFAIESNFDFAKLSNKTADFLSRKYYNPDLPIYLFFDWGGTVSFCLAAQFDKASNTIYINKEFYVTPGGDMPTRLMADVLGFFQSHSNKTVYFVRDTYGDSKSIQKSESINQEAINTIKKANWKIFTKKHKFKEPPMHEKWQLMQKILNEKDSKLFRVRIDGNNCKYLIIAMKDAKVRQVGNELTKDKSLERNKTADQRTAPHSTDALDKGCYFLSSAAKTSSFIEVSI